MKREDALDYHSRGRPGKIAVVPTKPLANQRDLALAYSPGVAEPCLEIKANPDDAYRYTAKGNLVAVVTNGTAVLGLGDIGALAGKPVMEGKGNLFKQFADLDVFDLEVGSRDPDDVIRFCQLLEPTVGGINLEDIKAPDCFYIEETLRKTLNIPVFHDDQHGTAIISGAALLNALEVTGKPIEEIRVVFSGAGAAAISTAEHYVRLGVRREHILMCDRKGVIFTGRTDEMDPYKARFQAETPKRTIAEALDGADVFVGLSVAGAVTGEMVARMARSPIIFALANPVPEILPHEVRAVRDDAIIATGRSDYPNQVNNVLGFPFIFRGALDARATTINEEMKMAATHALAALAKEDVPESVAALYGLTNVKFGPDYLIPFPFDPRALLRVAPAVAWAAVASGVAREFIDLDEYRDRLEARLGRARGIMRGLISRAQHDPKRVVFPEGEDPKILRAAQRLVDEAIAHPILLGRLERVRQTAEELGIPLDGITLIEPAASTHRDRYAQLLWQKRQRKGLSLVEANQRITRATTFGSVMVAAGDADALLGGLGKHYPETVRPALEVIGAHPQVGLASGLYMLVFEKHVVFFADTTVNIDPTADQLALIAASAAQLARTFGITPRVAMLSFSNFGSVKHPEAQKMAEAVRILRQRDPELVVDGEMQADTAFSAEVLAGRFPFSALKDSATVLIFPNLSAGNIAYKLLTQLGGATAIGPILVGMQHPVHVLEQGADVQEIVNMAAVAVIDAQQRARGVTPMATY
ncbi:MAG: NADP-dependent malic enzyme [Gemmatimonadota bacterium]|nr:NADP-dependent malic enzyme [Gemmatimonadota bacterium]MDQ8147412.1 NADP-dependent malic enzyme [Gemmatimonadota bacterium]MDQ8149182.1 NADP-dependent malic enzyme [Gemmatimonadota bacterium]MDQ8155927.1 NADP-dependent malic enzyme [Gemmatimonadota bacterium]MDQ8176816.1 NADP-dependent malic enzyme [Gemmatimonadota bacterium]